LYKTSEPAVVQTKTLTASATQMAEFTDLGYLVDYEIQILYTQKAPSATKQYDGTKVTTKTCFGEPTKVNSLKAEEGSDGFLTISWQPPTTINAPKVCYYEVIVTETNFPSKYNRHFIGNFSGS